MNPIPLFFALNFLRNAMILEWSMLSDIEKQQISDFLQNWLVQNNAQPFFAQEKNVKNEFFSTYVALQKKIWVEEVISSKGASAEKRNKVLSYIETLFKSSNIHEVFFFFFFVFLAKKF